MAVVLDQDALFENLVKRYPGPIRTIDGNSFRAEKGGIFGFLDSNGVGNSDHREMHMRMVQRLEEAFRAEGDTTNRFYLSSLDDNPRPDAAVIQAIREKIDIRLGALARSQ